MTYFLAFIPYVFQLLFIIHIIKNNKPFFWLWLLVFLPYIGGVAYFIIEILPDLSQSKSINKMGSAIDGAFHPNKKIQDLERLVKRQETISNIVQLADAYTDSGNYLKAIDLYKSCLHGQYENDGEIQFKLITCLYKAGDLENAKIVLQQFKKFNEISNQEEALIELLVNEDYEKLQDIFDNTSNFQVGYNLVKHYLEEKNFDSANKIYENMKDIRKDYPLYKRGINQTFFKLTKKIISATRD